MKNAAIALLAGAVITAILLCTITIGAMPLSKWLLVRVSGLDRHQQTILSLFAALIGVFLAAKSVVSKRKNKL